MACARECPAARGPLAWRLCSGAWWLEASGTLFLEQFPLDDGAPGRRLGSPRRVPRADDAAQAAMAAKLETLGLRVTEQRDRCYFRSIYFREPGGVLFEIATYGPRRRERRGL